MPWQENDFESVLENGKVSYAMCLSLKISIFTFWGLLCCICNSQNNIIILQFKNIDKSIYGHRPVEISTQNFLITVQYQKRCSTVSWSTLQNVHREEFVILHIFKKEFVASIRFNILY